MLWTRVLWHRKEVPASPEHPDNNHPSRLVPARDSRSRNNGELLVACAKRAAACKHSTAFVGELVRIGRVRDVLLGVYPEYTLE